MNNQGPKYSFYYLLSLVALIFTAISAGLILFGIIDETVLDAWAQSTYRNFDNQYKFAISALLIAAPTYYVSVYFINKGLKTKELSLDSALRRWLTYLIVFVSALIILGVFIGIVNNFLSGALTLPFLLKLLSVLLISGAILSYYFWDIKRHSFVPKTLFERLFAIISIVVLSAIFIAAWFFVDLPKDARAKRLDDNLMNNIYQLESAVNNYYSLYERLPENLEEMQSDPAVYLDSNYLFDAENGKAIEYRREGDKAFLFCADFRRASENNNRPGFGRGDKSHEAGYDCIEGQLWSEINTKSSY